MSFLLLTTLLLADPSRESSKHGRELIKKLTETIRMGGKTVVLSFHETLLHESDVELLRGPFWLNDTIISFYFEYLERVRFGGADDLLFVSPEVTQCIKMVGTKEIGIFLEPLGIQQKKFVFFALNDNDRPDTAGGSHWSLLVYSKPESSFFHLDSSAGSNDVVARAFTRHLTPFFYKTGSITFVSKPCAQQSNGYDCGVHVAINTERMAVHTRSHRTVAPCNTTVFVDAAEKRREILTLIHRLAKKS